MTTSQPTYKIAAAPRFAGMREWDCEICGHETLKRPVFLHSPETGLIAAGTGCASVALFGRREAHLLREVRRDFDAITRAEVQADELRVDRRQRYSTAAAAFAVRDDGDVHLQAARRTYHDLGGSKKLGLFPTWIAHVAATGDLDLAA